MTTSTSEFLGLFSKKQIDIAYDYLKESSGCTRSQVTDVMLEFTLMCMYPNQTRKD